MVETSYVDGEPGLSSSRSLSTNDVSLMMFDQCKTLDQTAYKSINLLNDQPKIQSTNQSNNHSNDQLPVRCTQSGDEYLFEPILFSDVTIHYLSASYHVHATVLYTASKFFNVLLAAEFSTKNQSNNQSGNECEVTSRCSRANHRCIHFDGSSLGGAAITSEEFYEFLVHVYAHVDGTGQWSNQAVQSNKRSIEHLTLENPSQTTDKLPQYYYIARISHVDVETDTVTYQCFGYDETSEQKVRGGSILVAGSSVKATTQSIGSWIFSLSVVDSPNYHLAYYFQCDTLMKKYEKQAETVLKHASSTALYFPVWKLLRLADRYHWSMRPVCLELCLKDKHCATRAGWHSLYKTLDPNTSAELFSLALKRT